MVLEPDDVATVLRCVQRRADRRHRLDEPGIDTTVDDSERLAMLRTDDHLGDDLVGRRLHEADVHRLDPAVVEGLDIGGVVARLFERRHCFFAARMYWRTAWRSAASSFAFLPISSTVSGHLSSAIMCGSA